MCVKIFGGGYILILLFGYITSHALPESHNEGDARPSKHHSRTRSNKNEHKTAKFLPANNIEPKEIRMRHSDKVVDEKPDILVEKETENINPEEDVSKTGLDDGTNTKIHLDGDVDFYDGDDEVQNSRVKNDLVDNLDYIDENVEIIDSPGVADQDLYQDGMIDVKARNGEPLLESGRRFSGSAESAFNVHPNLRQPVITEDYIDNIFRPYDMRKDPKQNSHYNNDFPMYNNKQQINLLQPYLRQNYPFFNNILNGKEKTNPRPNGYNYLWGQNKGPQAVQSFGIPSYASTELCTTCQLKTSQGSQEHRRSTDIYLTANGRSLDTAPVDFNSYPFVRDVSNVMQRPEQNLPQEADRAHRNIENSGANQDNDHLHKIIIPNNNAIVMNRRLGLAGYHVITAF